MAERPEDLNLPNAVITRIMKEALPDGVNVSKEARRAISQAASVFVLYATSCANNFAMKSKRKTLSAGDVMTAMEEMEFERFLQPLQEALEAYKKGQKGKQQAEQKRKDKEKNGTDENDKSSYEEEDEHMDEQDGGEEDVEN
ncbi:DNA polymerase epsilon subunit 3-like [Myxocyprinus asiaticus]|uniref:DNA polymerase epsilon subunit 3-like n=1 Tax=Myxocyprinus asiaticus TaxID=70543 RepID=UPI0022217E45|nr:DNA polymerase epsilon subunit 3-like [Myxocyprinus asiaticus]